MNRSLSSGRWLVLLGVVLSAGPAEAAGALVARSGEVTVAQIHAAIVLEENTTALILQVGLTSGGGDLAWVIPTTGLAPALSDVDLPAELRPIASEAPPDAFARLHEATAARLVTFSEKRRDLGCTELGRLSETPTAAPPWAAYAVSRRELRVFDRAASDGLAGWLGGRGYGVSTEAETLLDELAAEGRFFALVELGGVALLGEEGERSSAASPVLLFLRGSQKVVPLWLAQLSAAAQVEVVLWVIGADRNTVTSYATAELEVDAWLGEQELDDWYAETIDAAFADRGQPTFVVEHADFIDYQLVQYLLRRPVSVADRGAIAWFATRMRARLAPAELTADATLAPVPGDPEDQRLRVRVVRDGEPRHASLPLWGTLLVVALGWRITRRRG